MRSLAREMADDYSELSQWAKKRLWLLETACDQLIPHAIEIGITADQLFDELMEEHSGRHRDLAMMAGQ